MRNAHSTFLSMNTAASYTLCGGMAKQADAAARSEARRVEQRLSRFIPQSDIGRLNGAAGSGSVTLDPETIAVLSAGLECSENTGGCFDMTVGPLVRLWKGGMPPDEQELAAARELTGFACLTLDRSRHTAGLQKPGQSVDLGGIAKGYAADRMLAVFRSHRVKSAFLDFGGNVAVLGAKPDGTPWSVGIRHPGREGAVAGVLQVTNRSVVTSGDDQRAVRGADGVLRSHIIDPRTGWPAHSGLLSVTVVSQRATLADALATALFTAGMGEGLRILARYPDTQAIFIDRDLSVFYSSGLAGSFRAADGIRAYQI